MAYSRMKNSREAAVCCSTRTEWLEYNKLYDYTNRRNHTLNFILERNIFEYIVSMERVYIICVS